MFNAAASAPLFQYCVPIRELGVEIADLLPAVILLGSVDGSTRRWVLSFEKKQRVLHITPVGFIGGHT